MYNMHMEMLNEDINFEWNNNKAFSNKLKHDVSFERATKNEAKQTGLPYQSLINMYLGQCVREGKHLSFV